MIPTQTLCLCSFGEFMNFMNFIFFQYIPIATAVKFYSKFA